MHHNICANLTKALHVYREHNGAYPKRIIVYRDGIGDGQIQAVKEVELKQIKAAMREVIGSEADSMSFAFIIVCKRINTRFFRDNNGAPPTNPQSGTVVDDVVTLPERCEECVFKKRMTILTIFSLLDMTSSS